MLSRTREMVRTEADGFTLVELLVVIVLITVVGGVVLSSMVQGMQSNAMAQERIDAYNDMQLAGERITRELRAANPVLLAEPDRTQVRLQRDGACRRFSFQVEGTTLMTREQVSTDGCATLPGVASRPLVPSLDLSASPVFLYLDRDGTVTNVPADVATIELTLTRQLPDQPSVVLRTRVSVRNS